MLCGLITSSSGTIAEQQDSRNQNHWRFFSGIKDRLRKYLSVLDRAFSYLAGLLRPIEAEMHFAICTEYDQSSS